jgi:phosphoribosyl 1,2-cyclic phosphodiesterase
MMRFASLGSGSDGNALVVEAGGTRILVDCGFGLEETRNRLGQLGVDCESISAIVVTHEHDDHIRGVGRFAKKYNVPVWLTHGTLRAAEASFDGLCGVQPFECRGRLEIGAIAVEPYTVPHDAREPAQFVFGDGALRLGLLTDAGAITAHIQEVLNRVDALVVECNHDLQMLWEGPYPATLKHRIAGRFGHLDNGSAERLLAAIDASRLQHVIAAHISRQNNTPALAVDALARALGCRSDCIGVATQHDGFGWRVIS